MRWQFIAAPFAHRFRLSRIENILAFGFPAYHTERCTPEIGQTVDFWPAVEDTLNILS